MPYKTLGKGQIISEDAAGLFVHTKTLRCKSQTGTLLQMNAAHLKQIKDHPDTWDFINLVSRSSYVKNPEKIAARMIFNKDNRLYTQNKSLFDHRRRASTDGHTPEPDGRSAHVSQGTASPRKSPSRSPQREVRFSPPGSRNLSWMKGLPDESSFVQVASPRTANKDLQTYEVATHRTRTSDRFPAELVNDGDYWVPA